MNRLSAVITGLIFLFLFAASVMASDDTQYSFYGGYCSKYTEAGDWDVSWGRYDPRMLCNLVEQRLIKTGSPVKKTSMGYYDRYDMNQVEVRCRKKKHSFSMDGFGDNVVGRAYMRIKYSDATHCLFKVEPHFQ